MLAFKTDSTNENFLISFHYIPATRSRTATLLRLHPNYQSLNGFY